MKATQYLLTFILTFGVIAGYLMFLAQRDSKMMNYYDSTIQQRVRAVMNLNLNNSFLTSND